MNILRKYITLLNKMFAFRNVGNEKAEDETLAELDNHWWKQMDQETRDEANNLVIFESKEKFLSFQNAWKQFIKDGKHKKYKVPYKYYRWNAETKKYESAETYFWKSDLKIEHHLLYGLLRNKKIHNMFKPTIKPEGYPPSHLYALKIAAYYINSVAAGNNNGVEHLLKPFGNTLTFEDIQKASDRLKKIAEKTSNFKNIEAE